VSVHRAAFYVRRANDDALMVVAIENVGGSPGGILVRGTSDLRTVGLRVGLPLLSTPDGWVVPDARVRIDIASAVAWSPALPTAARRAVAAWTPRRLAEARTIAAGLAPVGSLASGRPSPGDPWSTRIVDRLQRQVQALTDGARIAAADAALDSIGVGPGLTPSGDDVLVGLLAGLDALDHPLRRDVATTIEGAAPGRTTSIGAATLVHAASGGYTEWLHDVVVALGAASGDGDPLPTAIARAMTHGATSGGDTLVGLFAAMEVATAGAGRPARAAA
jgi:hypothetical protein